MRFVQCSCLGWWHDSRDESSSRTANGGPIHVAPAQPSKSGLITPETLYHAGRGTATTCPYLPLSCSYPALTTAYSSATIGQDQAYPRPAALVRISSQVPMFTVKQVAERHKVSGSLIYREIHAGRLQAHCFGKRTYRISEAQLAEYEAHCQANAPDRQDGLSHHNNKNGANGPTQFKHLDVSRLLASRK